MLAMRVTWLKTEGPSSAEKGGLVWRDFFNTGGVYLVVVVGGYKCI